MKKYRVLEDDTIHKVAWKHRILVQQLIDANPHLENEKYIYPGDNLTIPEPCFNKTSIEKEGECIKEFSHVDLLTYVNKWRSLAKELPIKVETIGYSVMEKPIYLLKIGNGEKQVFYSGGWH